jgi:ElaB/YqjD/DUF883 family membrane-anchored ribosome-binding protein
MDTRTANFDAANTIARNRKSNGNYLTQSTRQWTEDKDRLLEDFKTLVSDSEELLRSTAHLSGDAIVVARKNFEQQWNQAKERLDHAQQYAREQGRQVTATADDYVNKNPWRAIGIASGVGLLIGLMFSRRN